MRWAELSKRAFGVDVMSCEQCGYTPVEAARVVENPAVADL
jgi:predicted nucleic-acid-binding Zn-ribbon protein